MERKQILWGTVVCLILLFAITACTMPAAEETSSDTEVRPTRGDSVVDLPDMGEAPEFQNEVWLNSNGPVTLAAQRGKVVLLEFWTFG